MNLSKPQEEIVKAPIHGALQVLASAGSGKTRVLTERIRFILNETKHDNVIGITFTNKAANEMRERLSSSNQAEERAWIATIHSVAQHILEKYAHTIGLSTQLHIYERDVDRKEVFLQSLRDSGIDMDDYLNVSDVKAQKNIEKYLQDFLERFSKIKREMLLETDVQSLYGNTDTWRFYQDYQNTLLASGGIDYDDILLYAHQILITHEWVARIYQARYKHICVDEAQDLNKAQYEFIKAICGDAIKSVMFVGDPNQMIYGFNSSSKDFLCKSFIQDFKPQPFELNENFRSTRSVIRTANKLKAGAQKESEFALEGKVGIKEFWNEDDEANWIVATIKNLLDMKIHSEIEGDITLDRMVVIARNRFVFNVLEEVLEREKIIYSLKKNERQSELTSKFGKALDYATRLRVNPKDWVNGKKLCQLLGVNEPSVWSEGVLGQIALEISPSQDEGNLFSCLISRVHDLDTESPNIPKFIREFRTKLEATARESNNISIEATEELNSSIRELEEFNDSWIIFRRKGLGESLAAFRNALALGQLSPDSIELGLTLSTVHTMKGLEKDIVFLMGMCEGVFPDYRAKSKLEMEEERNNAFVAVTRAKRWLFITYPKNRMMPWGDSKRQNKSQFLNDIQNEPNDL